MGERKKKRTVKVVVSGGRIGEFFKRARRKSVPKAKPVVQGGKIVSFFGPTRKTSVKRVRRKSVPTAKPVVQGGKIASFFGPAWKSPVKVKAKVKGTVLQRRPSPVPTASPRRKPAVTQKRSVQAVRIPSPEVLQKRAALAEAQALYKTAVARFKPKKSELGTVVFVAAKPPKGRSQRLDRRSRKKGFAIYVTKTGKLEPLREQRRKPPVPRKRASVDPAKFRRKAAREAGQRSVFARVSGKKALSRMFKPGRGRKSVDWLKVADHLAGAMSAGMVTERRAHTQVVSHAVVVRTKEGMTRTFTATTNLMVSDEQAKTSPGPDWNAFAGKVNEAYGLIAEQLKAANMVSRGSADYIRGLDLNEDVEDQVELLGEDGQRWEKNECDVVDIVSWSFEIGVGILE